LKKRLDGKKNGKRLRKIAQGGKRCLDGVLGEKMEAIICPRGGKKMKELNGWKDI